MGKNMGKEVSKTQRRLDKLIDHIILSRRFICLIIFIILKINGYVSGTELLVIAGMFMGNNALEKILAYKREKNGGGKIDGGF